MSEQVDLSLCQPGDVCHLRSCGTTPFNGPNRENSDVRRKEFLFAAGGVGYRRDGRFMRDRESAYDIVRVTRDGQTITPVPVAGEQAADDDPDLLTFLEQAGAGCISGRVADWPQLKPACKWAAEEIKRLRAVQPAATGDGETLGRLYDDLLAFFSGLGVCTPEEGFRRAPQCIGRCMDDVRKMVYPGLLAGVEVTPDARWDDTDAFVVACTAFSRVGETLRSIADVNAMQDHLRTLGYAIQKLPSAPPSPPAEEQCCLCGSPMNAGSCTGDPDGCVMVVTDKPAEVPQAVITGPGKYVNKWGDVATIIGPAGDMWVGYFEDSHGHKTAYLFESDGKKHTTYVAFAGSLTGPYAPPQEPVLELTEQRRENGWVYAWTKINRHFENPGISESSNPEDVGEMVRAGRHVYVNTNGPLVVVEADWPRVQELVAQVNAQVAAGKPPVSPASE